MRACIVQSFYAPWKGFFDMLGRCDVYVIYDTSNYSKGHWHNRNKIKRPAGPPWMTIPVKTSDRLGQPIDEVEVTGSWAAKHWAMLRESYRDTPFFADESCAIEKLYEDMSGETRLSRINERFLRFLVARLGIKTQIVRDRDFVFGGERNARLVQILQSLGATHYLSGPAAKSYLNESLFKEANIELEWMSYGPYATYPQPHGEFSHVVSVIDTIFCCGPDVRAMIARR